MSTVLITAFSPVWASEMTSWTPTESAGLRRPQERGPERPVLAVTDLEAEHPAPMTEVSSASINAAALGEKGTAGRTTALT